MYTEKDLELCVAGMEEIDRKRKMIVRLLNGVYSLIRQYLPAPPRPRWRGDEECGNATVYILLNDGIICWICCHHERGTSLALPSWTYSFDDKHANNELGRKDVDRIWSLLPVLLSRLGRKFPRAKVKEHFDFFIEQGQRVQAQ